MASFEEDQSLLSLQSHCVLTIISHCATYPVDTLSLLPPRLRVLIAHNASPYDLHRLEQGAFFKGLENRVQIQDLWKRRYENTLLKFSNISGLDIDMELHHPSPSTPLSLSWKDRYLLACLLNFPRIYSNAGGEWSGLQRPFSPWGVAIFGLTDLLLPKGQIHREKLDNDTKHGLHCFPSSQRITPGKTTSYFVSVLHMSLIETIHSEEPRESEWSIQKGLKLFSFLFPSWCIPYAPVLYDRDAPLMVAEDIVGKSRRAIVYSGWYITRNNAEISESDFKKISPHLSKSFQSFFESFSSKLETLVFLPPAVLKEDGGNYSPFEVSTSTLIQSVAVSLPVLKQLSISMHACDIKCLSLLSDVLPSLHHTLTTLHLKVVRPKFPEPSLGLGPALCDLYKKTQVFQDLILQGLFFDRGEFINLILSYLTTAKCSADIQESVTLRNIKVKGSGNGEIEKQVMPQNSNKSLFVYRLLDTEPLHFALSAFDELRLNTISFTYITEKILIPSDLKIIANTVRIERIILNEERLEALRPLLVGNVRKVELSLANAFPPSIYQKCLEASSQSLSYFDMDWFLPDIFKELTDLEAFFAMLFSLLPPSCLSNLELNFVQLIKKYASYLLTKENNSGVWLTMESSHAKSLETKNTIRLWNLLYKSWKENANGCKLKFLHVTVAALDEVYDKVMEMAVDLIENF